MYVYIFTFSNACLVSHQFCRGRISQGFGPENSRPAVKTLRTIIYLFLRINRSAAKHENSFQLKWKLVVTFNCVECVASGQTFSVEMLVFMING